MLVKKVKVVAPDGAEPSTEERYILTADINRMADLVGLSSSIVKDVLKRALDNPNNTYYGEARSADYFHKACNVWENIKPEPRKFDLDHIHLRVSDRVKTDASGSFLIVPVSVTAPLLVGDVSKGYELIPHIVLESHEPDNYSKVTTHASIFRPLGDSFVHEQVKSPSDNVDFRLVGFDLLLVDNGEDFTPFPKVFQAEINVTSEPTYNPDLMVYDFGYGVVMQAEINLNKDTLKLTVMRNGTQLTPSREKRLSLVSRRLTIAPHELLADAYESDTLMTVATVEFAKQSTATPQDHATVRWLLERIADGYIGTGWRN